MQIIDLSKIKQKEAQLIKAIKAGKLFIYPTDTIYGIGCDAVDAEAVEKIRRLKKREQKPFSVIAPSKEWIYSNLKVKDRYKCYIEQLPGPFTFVLQMRKQCVAENVAKGTLGARLPGHIFSKLVSKAETPFVTTSVNISGKPAIMEISQIPKGFLKAVDIIIDSEKLDNKPSTIIDLTGDLPKILR